MRRIALVLTLLAACGGDDPPTGPMTVEVTRYDYAFDLESRDGHAALTLAVTDEGDCVTLPVRADVVGDVLLDGAVAEVTRQGDAITVCGAGWREGVEVTLDADVTVSLETWGASQVGYSITEDANDVPFYYLVSWVGGCDRFGPCDHRPDVFPRYQFTVTHPADVTVLCPGEIDAGATQTVCTFERDGGPTYSTFGIVASAGWEVTERPAWNGVAVTIYNRAGSGVPARLDDAYHAGFLAWMEDRFGAYPFGDALRIITGPTYWSGFEHPGNIVLSDGLAGPFSGTAAQHTMNHELAHMWAGDQTTLAGTYDFVWKEAMAEYLTFVYEDDTVPTDAVATARGWKSGSRGAAYHPVPADEPALLDYYGDVYGPGPMVLFRQLEALYSRQVVLDGIASVLGSPRALSIADVQLALEDATGADLTGYFDRWIHGSGAPTWPEFSIALNDTGEDVEVTVTQLRPEDGLYGCAFDVRLQGATADQRVDVPFDLGVDGTAQATEIAVAPGFDPVTSVLDPHATCLAYPPGVAMSAPRHAPGWSPWVAPRR